MAITYEIFPAIGVARLGTSDDFFLGPEPDGTPPTKYRDSAGNLLRQAARFRVYRCDRDASGVLNDFREMTSDLAVVTWFVEIANRKASAARIRGGGRRNNATGDDTSDAALIINPSPKSVAGANAAVVAFDDGLFKETKVFLGDVRTDDAGRLIFLGGHGLSASASGAELQGWSESDDWYDDVSDGPIKAKIKLADTGEEFDAIGAWVIVGPPDFAPELTNLVTLYDTIVDVADARGLGSNGRLPASPAITGWDTEILPILQRAMRYQWVNNAAQQNHSAGKRGDFTSSLFWAGIDQPAQPNTKRQNILRLLRKPGSSPTQPSSNSMPRLYDDDYLLEGSHRDRLPLSKRQYSHLDAWASGNFVSIGTPSTEPFPERLTRVALEACVGGAFVPGIEVTRTIRDSTLYMDGEPFRIANTVKAGTITQNMALPWQTDFTDCGWDVQPQLGWWPAQRPNQVFDGVSPAMVDWLRFSGGDDFAQFHEMIDHWSQLGIVRDVSATGGPSHFQETERTYTAPPAPAPPLAGAASPIAETTAPIAELQKNSNLVIHKFEEP